MGRFEALLDGVRDQAIPIGELGTDAANDRIFAADIIWGYDPQQDAMPLFYGRELIEDIAKGREAEFGYLALVCFVIDLKAGDAERLREAIEKLKGPSCYRPL